MSRYDSMTLVQLKDAAQSSTERPFYILEKDKYVAHNQLANTAWDIESKAKNSLYEAIEYLDSCINICEESLLVNGRNPFADYLYDLRSKLNSTVSNFDLTLQINQPLDEDKLDMFDKEVKEDLEDWYDKYFKKFCSVMEDNLRSDGYTNFERTSDGMIRIAKKTDPEGGVGAIYFNESSKYLKYSNNCPYPNYNIAYGYQNGVYGVDYCICRLQADNYVPSYDNNVGINGESVQPSNHKYDDATYKAFPNLMTRSEFTRRKNAGSADLAYYDNYEEYFTYSPKTITCGTQVVINGETCYFLMRDERGTMYFTKGTSPYDQVFCLNSNGTLVPRVVYDGNGGTSIPGREEFLQTYCYSGNSYSVTYATDFPFDSVGSTAYDVKNNKNVGWVDTVFAKYRDNEHRVYDTNFLRSNATAQSEIHWDKVSIGQEKLPKIIYIAPGTEVVYDKPYSAYNTTIKGGSNGCYLVYDGTVDGYYAVDTVAGTSSIDSAEDRSAFISTDNLTSNRTSIKTKK